MYGVSLPSQGFITKLTSATYNGVNIIESFTIYYEEDNNPHVHCCIYNCNRCFKVCMG